MCSALVAAVRRLLAERVGRRLHAHGLVQFVGAGLRRRAGDPVPDPERERRADDILGHELFTDLGRAPPLLHGDAHRIAFSTERIRLERKPHRPRRGTAPPGEPAPRRLPTGVDDDAAQRVDDPARRVTRRRRHPVPHGGVGPNGSPICPRIPTPRRHRARGARARVREARVRRRPRRVGSPGAVRGDTSERASSHDCRVAATAEASMRLALPRRALAAPGGGGSKLLLAIIVVKRSS